MIRFSAGFVAFAVTIILVITGGVELFRNFGYLYQLWEWSFLLSPALYIYAAASIGAVWIPITGCTVLPGIIRFVKISPSRGLLSIGGFVLVMVFANYACQAVAWGSLPLTKDNATGDLYMRMVPFVPWPNYPFHW